MTISADNDLNSLKAPFITKLARFIELTASERAYLSDMQADFLEVRAGVDIITAGHAYRCIFVLNKGMAIRYKVLHDGRRQVLSLILPGDFIGVPGGMFDNSLYSISGLTDAVVCAASFNTMFALFRDHPRLGAALFWVASHDAALFAEHLVGLGRQSAYERMARLVLELLTRLQIAGLADDRSYELPMTQELVADTLGLSAAHVNRTLRRMREDGLISFQGTRLTCLDVPALSRLADFDGVNFGRQRVPGL